VLIVKKSIREQENWNCRFESHKAKMELVFFHTPEAIDVTAEILDLKENRFIFERKGERKDTNCISS